MWPGITTRAVRRHLPKSIITSLGHLDQQRANKQSTKTPPIAPTTPTAPRPPTPRTHNIFVDCRPITGQIFSDLPGRFVLPSSRGNNYLLVVYDYDSNAILAEPIKNRTATQIVSAYQRIHRQLVASGLRPSLQRLDNEASALLRDFLAAEQIDYQLVPPHLHRRNSAERAIRTFKNHFVSILCGTDPNFPLHLWDRLLPQALLTLNLLRASHINPRLSAQAQIYGAFDFNRTPLGPLGTKVIAHTKPTVRESWAKHGAPSWYIGRSCHHYRCYLVYVSETGAERNADTLDWFPHHVSMPKTSSADAAATAAYDLIQALKQPAPASPFASLDPKQLSALDQLAQLFQSSTNDAHEPPALPRVDTVAAPIPAPRVDAVAAPSPHRQRTQHLSRRCPRS
jgi:hypothetical protein